MTTMTTVTIYKLQCHDAQHNYICATTEIQIHYRNKIRLASFYGAKQNFLLAYHKDQQNAV